MKRIIRRWAALGVAIAVGAAVLVTTSPPEPASATTTVYTGPQELVTSWADRQAAGLQYWPDGSMGVVKDGADYTFLSNNSTYIARTEGTLEDPLAASVSPSISIGSPKQSYQYMAGGPVYVDPDSGSWLMFYHAELWKNNNAALFYSLIGMAISDDEGATWTDLGEILRLDIDFADITYAHDATGGTFAVHDGYFYVYFHETNEAPTDAVWQNDGLGVVRAPVADVVEAAVEEGDVVDWYKYYDGDWDEPGIGGHSTDLWPGGAVNWGIPNWLAVSWNDYLQKFILITTQLTDFPAHAYTNFVYLESSDGLSWSSPQTILSDVATEDAYQTIVGLGEDPTRSGAQFYLYYLSDSGGDRWGTAFLARRLISLTVPVVRGSTVYTASGQFSSTQGADQWNYQSETSGTYTNMTWNSGGGYWKGSGTYSFVGSSWQHPESNENAVRTWTAPLAGTANIAGRVAKRDWRGGDGTNSKILLNSTQLFSQNVAYNDVVGYAYDETTAVASGDFVRFTTNQLTGNSYDATQYDPQVYFTPSAMWDPERQFSTTTQGANQWRYQWWDGSTYDDLDWHAAANAWRDLSNVCDWCYVGPTIMHPGNGGEAVRTWTAPSSGTVLVQSYVRDADWDASSDGVIATIWKNSTSLYSQLVGPGRVDGYVTSFTVSVTTGDKLHFRIADNTYITGDSTIWDTTITYQ